MIKFKLMVSFIIILSISSCLVKKNRKTNEKIYSTPVTMVVSRGTFIYKSELYYSNGKDTYCIFKSHEDAKNLLARINMTVDKFPVKTLPEKMTYNHICSENDIK